MKHLYLSMMINTRIGGLRESPVANRYKRSEYCLDLKLSRRKKKEAAVLSLGVIIAKGFLANILSQENANIS